MKSLAAGAIVILAGVMPAQAQSTLRTVPTGIDVPGCAPYALRGGRVVEICDTRDFRRWRVNRGDVAWYLLTPQGGSDSAGGGSGSSGK